MLAVGWTCAIRVCIRVMRHGRLGDLPFSNWTHVTFKKFTHSKAAAAAAAQRREAAREKFDPDRPGPLQDQTRPGPGHTQIARVDTSQLAVSPTPPSESFLVLAVGPRGARARARRLWFSLEAGPGLFRLFRTGPEAVLES